MDWLAEAVEAAAASSPQEPTGLIPAKVEGRVLLVDGDMIAYSNAGNDECPPARARLSAIARLETMRDMSGSEKIVVHLTSNSSTKGDRYVIATVKPYQAHRKGSKRPKNWGYLRDWMESYTGDLFTVKTWGTREADDGIAYHATVLGVDRACIATADKDMRMIPAWHLDWQSYTMTRLDTEFRVTGENGKLYGHAWFWQQVLQGDAADGIPGLPKWLDRNGKAKLIGEVTAKKFIDSVSLDNDALIMCASLYKTWYAEDWADQLVEQMALLWMRRDKQAAIDDAARWFCTDITCPVQVACHQAFERLVERVNKAKEDLPWSN